MSSEVKRHVRTLWEYMNIDDVSKPADIIIAFGTFEATPAIRSAELYKDNYAPLILFAGNQGERGTFQEPEAILYKKIALEYGVPDNIILTEIQSTNSEENTLKSYELLRQKSITPQRIILVQKPGALRRFRATFLKFWPDKRVNLQMTCEQVNPDKYLFQEKDSEKRINHMVGDLQRLHVYAEDNYKKYPELFREKDWKHINETNGFLVTEKIPQDVWNSWHHLKESGYNHYLIESYKT